MVNNMIENTVTFVDLIILREIFNYSRINKTAPPIHILHTNINFYISKNEIPESHVVPISRYRLQQTIEKLRRFGFIEPRGKYKLTRAGKKFAADTSSLWWDWPIYIPMINNIPHFDKAFYLRSK